MNITISVPAVGFRLKEGLLTESVDESVARTFACVEVIQGTGPLTSDVTIEIFTQDGSATGKLTCCTQIILCVHSVLHVYTSVNFVQDQHYASIPRRKVWWWLHYLSVYKLFSVYTVKCHYS